MLTSKLAVELPAGSLGSTDSLPCVLVKKWQEERLLDETFRNLLDQSHYSADSSSVTVEMERLRVGGHRAKEEGCDLIEGTPSSDDEPGSTCVKDSPLWFREVGLWNVIRWIIYFSLLGM